MGGRCARQAAHRTQAPAVAGAAAAQIRLSCPASTRSRGMLADNGGRIGQQLWRTGRGRDQVTKQAYDFHDVVAQAPPTLKPGESASGSVYILCRG